MATHLCLRSSRVIALLAVVASRWLRWASSLYVRFGQWRNWIVRLGLVFIGVVRKPIFGWRGICTLLRGRIGIVERES
ncbi:hypothetical protein BJX65DRAFT_262863 [Aspergillus insuetus]